MSDRRAIATAAQDTLGQDLGNDAKRDAIHIAVEPLLAMEVLKPGQRVKVSYSGEYAKAANGDDWQGIVDPWRTEDVQVDQRFWFIMRPGVVKDLRHVWDAEGFKSSFETIEIGYDDGCRGC